MLNSDIPSKTRGGGYKSLARKTNTRECGILETAVSEVVVDFRSRLFRYMRLAYANRTQRERALSVFRTMRDIRTTGEVFTEKRRVFDAALLVSKREAGRVASRCTYVFPSAERCPHRVDVASDAEQKLEELKMRMSIYRRDMFDMKALEQCALALESYVMSDFDNISKMHAGGERFLGVGAHRTPDESDSFESDRLCARLSMGIGVAVLSEDFDIVALFGADLVVTEVHAKFFVYASLRDTAAAFNSSGRKDTIHRCCIMGTDYNLGLRGVGPVKAKKIDTAKAKELFETCTAAQSIRPDVLYRFFLVPADERTMNEVVMSDSRKLFIDIDAERGLLDMYDFERHVESRIQEVFAMLEIGKPDVVMYKMTDEHGKPCNGKLSYHAVVSNFRFTAGTCMGLCMIVSSGQAWEACADTGVYKTVQCVRMEGSTKHGEKRWKWATSDADFKSGIVSHLEGTSESELTCSVENLQYCHETPFISCSDVDMSQFKASRYGSSSGAYVQLRRIRPGYCPQCSRTHDRENATVKYVMGRPVFVCWRSVVGQ